MTGPIEFKWAKGSILFRSTPILWCLLVEPLVNKHYLDPLMIMYAFNIQFCHTFLHFAINILSTFTECRLIAVLPIPINHARIKYKKSKYIKLFYVRYIIHITNNQYKRELSSFHAPYNTGNINHITQFPKRF